jgi:PAS domain S-box-containing protein
MDMLVSLLSDPAAWAGGLAAAVLVLGLLLWHNTRTLAQERERNRENTRVARLFNDVGGLTGVERGLHAAIEALPDAFVLYDPHDRLVICNSRYRELYATSADVIRVGNRFEDMLRAGVARGQYSDAIDDPEAWIERRMAIHRNPPSSPIVQKLDDGRWLRIFEKRMPDGHTVGFRIDITELKQREEALRLSEERLAAMVSGAFDAIVAIDGEGAITEFNPAAERVFGYTREQVMGRNARDLLVPERFRGEFERRIQEAIRQGPGGYGATGERVETKSLRADGSEILTEITFNCMESGEGIMVTGFVRDITEDRARSRALADALARREAADRARSDFLAMMSHEIRTPLNAVIGLLDVMEEAGLEPAQLARARTARGSAEALLQILNDILDVSRLEARRIEFVEVPFLVRDLVSGVGDLLTPRAEAKGFEIVTHVAQGVPAVLSGDAGRLRQILINLVSNAVKFTQDGEVRLRLDLRAEARETGDGGRIWPICFSVEDTGPGVPVDQREQIFERFRTLVAPDGTRSEGVGLGLSICRELVTGMGGEIRLEESPEGGCRFVVDLELPESDREVMAPGRGELSGEEARVLRGAAVLLVEDTATNRMVAEDLLTRWGCRHRSAVDGLEALGAIETGRFDAVLMDVTMPGMSGYEVARRVRQGTSENRDVPIIALTAHSGADAREKARDAGMTAFATKPIDSHELGVLLARVLSERGREGAAGAAGPGAGPNQARGEPWGKVATATPVIRRAEAGFSGTDVVDPARFEATIADIPPDRRSIILERCVQDIRSQMETLQAAGGGNASDGAQLVSSAHVLGGLAETFGADRLARQARALERKGNRGIASGDVKSLLREAEEAAEVLADLARDEEARRREAD